MPDQANAEFESQFNDLAFASVRDTAPSLFDHLVGFQVLDVNDEQTRALGVFGCLVGDEWVYIPVFFLNGELKSGLMYLKNQDLFVPLQENWVTYVLNRRPYVLGEPSQMTRQEMSKSPPDFSSFAFSPNQFGKTASFKYGVWGRSNESGWVGAFKKVASELDLTKLIKAASPRKVNSLLEKLAHLAASSRPEFETAFSRLDLSGFIRTEGPFVAGHVAGLLKSSEVIADAALRFYNLDDLLVRDYSFSALANSNRLAKAAARFTTAEGPATPVKVEGPAVGKARRTDSHNALSDAPYYLIDPRGDKRWERDAKEKARAYRLSKSANDKNDACDPHVEVTPPTKEELPWKKTEEKPIKVDVITPDDLDTPGIESGLSESEKERLLKGEIVIKDHRNNTSKVYRAEIGRTLTSPDTTGIFKMLKKGGEFDDILVIHAPMTIGTGRANCVTAVVLSDKAAVNAPASGLTVQPSATTPIDWMRFFNDQKAADSLTTGKAYVLVTSGMKGTIPFRVLHKRVNADGTTEYWVKDNSNIPYAMKRALPRGNREHYEITHKHDGCGIPDYDDDHDNPSWWSCGRRIVVAGKPGGLSNVGDTLFVPSNAKAVEVKWDRWGDSFPTPGTAIDAENLVLSTDFVAALKVYDTGAGEYTITGKEKNASHLSRADALRHLCQVHGLGSSDAQSLLKEASLKKCARCLVHYADGYPMQKKAYDPEMQPGPNAPAIPEARVAVDQTGVPSVGPQPQLMPVPDMATPSGNRQLYNPDPRLDRPGGNVGNPDAVAQQAAQTNQKDVFDAGMIGSLLKTVDSGALVDKYIGDMILGLDRVGRTLFLYYQHSDAFKERYGEQDMGELEDSLRNVLKGLGELILFLRQKSTADSPETNRTEVDLTPVAN